MVKFTIIADGGSDEQVAFFARAKGWLETDEISAEDYCRNYINNLLINELSIPQATAIRDAAMGEVADMVAALKQQIDDGLSVTVE